MRVAAFALILLVAPAAQAADERFELVDRGATIQASIGMSRAGYRLMGDLGGETVGIASFGRRWLVAWDVLVAARVGVLANAEPYLPLYGGRAAAFIEPTLRLGDARWSPAVSLRLANEGAVLFNPRASLGELRSLNDLDGVGGVSAHGAVRVGGGASYLGRGRSLLVLAFVQEELRAHGVNSDAAAFTEGGVGARFDWTWGLSMLLDATVGSTLSRFDPALDRTSRTTRLGLGGSARKSFASGVWLALAASIARDTDHVVYEATGARFDTGSPADFTLGLALGVSPWRRR